MAKTIRSVVAARKRPSVAVVIPFYNGSKYIDRAARSVLSQTVPPDEFVVVNDGSRPEEAAYLHEAAKTYGFRVIDQENGGQSAARNAGVAASRSEFVSLLDQDDYYLDNHIEILLDSIPENDPHLGWVYGDLFEAEGNGDVLRTSMVTAHSKHPKTNAYELLGQDMFVLPSASLISRKAFDAVGGFDPQFTGYEDDDFFLRVFRKGFTNHFINKSVTVWCINEESTSYSIRMCRSRIRYFKKLVENFPDNAGKARFYLRDILIPRFHAYFVADVYNAIVCPLPERDMRLKPHLDELLSILREYVDIVSASPNVPQHFKRRAVRQYRLLATKSPWLVSTAQGCIDAYRRIAPRLGIRLRAPNQP